jgi:predicted RNA binding protein with dsRBD fold (UPF0201 family)
MEINVHIEVVVNPTENEDKVKKALFNLFGDLVTEVTPLHKGNMLTSKCKGQESLSTFRNVIARDRIRDAARKSLHGDMKSECFTFYLNKQVAYAGHVSFSEAEAESSLGPIKVVVSCEFPLELIDWLAPRTSKS